MDDEYAQVESKPNGPVERNISWEITADGQVIHKNPRYYVCTVVDILWRVILGSLAVYMIIIGSLYLVECRIEKRIPLFMIVGGIALLPVVLLAIYMVKRDRVFEGLFKLIGAFVCSPVILFVIAWTVVGGVWTYGVASDVDLFNRESDQYCNPLLYVSAAISIIVLLLLLSVFLFISVRYFRRGVQRGVDRH